MRRYLFCMLLCLTMIMSSLSGCSPAGKETQKMKEKEARDVEEVKTAEEIQEEKKYAIVVKSKGNHYNEKMIEGFRAVMDEQNATYIVKEPEHATPEEQRKLVDELIEEGVATIAIAANDTDALQQSLEKAMEKGIKVCGMDSAVNASSRQLFINQAGTDIIGQTLLDAVYDISGGEGQWAILSATEQASNQNSWIAAMKEYMKQEKYKDMELVEVVYGDDEEQISAEKTKELLVKYPNLKVICSPTTVGIMSAAKVLKEENSTVKITGLGLPSEMASYIGTGESYCCPYMYLWNPVDIGRMAAYVSLMLDTENITGTEGEVFTAGELGEYVVVKAEDGGTEVILGPPFAFTPENISEWENVY